ncbi:MAG: hypothetical protein K8J08_18375 [Thermoanaerobaculia bacterium]|nr:hypothetical protein [Thermoanaerobaculia bacterium]
MTSISSPRLPSAALGFILFACATAGGAQDTPIIQPGAPGSQGVASASE